MLRNLKLNVRLILILDSEPAPDLDLKHISDIETALDCESGPENEIVDDPKPYPEHRTQNSI